MKKSIFLKILAFNLFFVSNFAFAFFEIGDFSRDQVRIIIYWGIGIFIGFHFLRFLVTSNTGIKGANKRILKNLKFMEKHSDEFDWIRLKQKIKNIFIGVTQARASGDYYQVNDLVTKLFWKGSQGMNHDEIKNIKIKNVSQISPILFKPTTFKQGYIDSLLVTLITFEATGENKNYSINQIWSFTIEDGSWKVCNIEEYTETELNQYITKSEEIGVLKDFQ